MKHIFFIILFAASFSTYGQTPYISTNGRIILQTGSIQQFDTPDIYVSISYNVRLETWTAHLDLYKPASTSLYGEYNINYTKSDINAYTGTGTQQIDKMQNAVSQAVAATLLALNPSITFTQN